MNISIRGKIYLSFAILVSVFVINAVITISIISNNKKLSKHITEVVDPSVKNLFEFRKLLLQSQMYSTNWVFIHSCADDKAALRKIHSEEFPELKSKLVRLSGHWNDTLMNDSLRNMISAFGKLITEQKSIMNSLKEFDDYRDPAKRFYAEQQLEYVVIPSTQQLIRQLNQILKHEHQVKEAEEASLASSTELLRIMITILACGVVSLGIFFSIYMSRIILYPLDRIRGIVNDLGKGIIKKLNYRTDRNEIGEMVLSINNLCEKLEATANFAHEVGNRNFNSYYQPLSDQDTLGKALLAMRDNLKSGDERLNEAQHIAHLGSWERDVANNRLIWSDEMFRIFEIDKRIFDHSYDTYLKMIHPDDLKMVRQLTFQSMNDLQPIAYECRIITKRGQLKNIYFQGKVITDSKGKIIKTYGVIQDITDRKKAEEELRQSEKHSRNLFDQSTVGLVLAKMDGTLVDVNETYANIIGYTVEEAKQLTYWEITPEQYNLIEKEKLKELEEHGRYSAYEKEYMHKNGQLIPVKMSGIILEKDGENFILSSVEDITESRKARQDILKKNEELRKTNSELDKFVYSVSHDLRAPLTSMLGIIEISREETEDPLMLEHLGMLKNGIQKLDGFILDILHYSRNARAEVKKSEIDFEDMIRDITGSLKFMGTTENNVDIRINIETHSAFISDKSRLAVVMNNLVSNAIRYQDSTRPDPFVEITVNTDEKGANIIVKDNGIGIRQDQHDKIFDMFYRVSENSVGSGLGLYIVKETIDKLNGRVMVDSEPGKGTCFNVYIPNIN